MHSYLRAIGFSKLKNKREQNTLITSALENATDKMEIEIGSGIRLVQINRSFGKNLGISIIGEYDNEEILSIDHFFPFCLGYHTTEQADIQIEPHTDKEAYSAVSEDYNLGMTLIYNLQNIVDYVLSLIHISEPTRPY